MYQTSGNIIHEFVALCAKLYSFKVDGIPEIIKKAKSV